LSEFIIAPDDSRRRESGDRQLRLANTINNDHIDGIFRPLLTINIACRREMVNHIVVVINMCIEGPLIPPAIEVPPSLGRVGLVGRASHNQDGPTVRLHMVQCPDSYRMINMIREDRPRSAFRVLDRYLILHITTAKGRIGNHGIDFIRRRECGIESILSVNARARKILAGILSTIRIDVLSIDVIGISPDDKRPIANRRLIDIRRLIDAGQFGGDVGQGQGRRVCLLLS
jgi:hypothetical protein